LNLLQAGVIVEFPSSLWAANPIIEFLVSVRDVPGQKEAVGRALRGVE